MQFKEDFELARKNMKDELSGAQNPLLVASRDILVIAFLIKFIG